MKTSATKPRIVLNKEGKPSDVLLGIKEYEELLERLEDVEDIEWLRKARKKKLCFRKLEDFLAETSACV